MAGSALAVPKQVLDVALDLAKANVHAEANISGIFLVPAHDRVLLVEVDPTALPNGEDGAIPVYFDASPDAGFPYPSGVVMVTPEEAHRRIPLPKGWGAWNDLVPIWPRLEEAS